jgi:hypothetical protein
MNAENMLIALVEALIRVQRRQSDADTAFIRDVVRDNQKPMHELVSPELPGNKVQVVGASSVDTWKPPSAEIFDNLMDIEDQRWRAQRKRELGQG